MSDDDDLAGTLAQITALIEGVEHLPDREARERARALVQAVLDIHRVGLGRVLAVAGARDGGARLVDELAAGRAIALLLSLHDLHPRDVESRVTAAIEEVATRLREVGVALDLVSVGGDSARVRVKPAGPVRASPGPGPIARRGGHRPRGPGDRRGGVRPARSGSARVDHARLAVSRRRKR